jgi:acyl-CoA synthetase (AMP-forming)/AMP-acid ligase II
MGPRPDTLAEAVQRSAASAPDRTALIIDEEAFGYAGFLAGAERRARQLSALGIGKGERVGLLLPNGSDYLELVAGAARLGIVVVPMNIRFRARELRHLILDSAMVALITTSGIEGVVDFPALLRETLPELEAAADWRNLALRAAPALRAIVRLDEPIEEAEVPAGPRVEGADPLLVMYTSGTTAHPKGCVISNRALLANSWAIIDRFRLSTDDLWWCPLPMFHIGGLLFPFTLIAAGGTYAGMAHFEPGAAVAMLRRHPPTIFYPLFSTISLAMIEHPDFAAADFGRLRMSCNVAPENVQRRIQAALPHAPLVGAFGMTEASGTVAYGGLDEPEEKRLATCGTPLPGWEVRILDPHSHARLPAGTRGEIAIRGPALFDLYLNDPASEAATRDADGFFRTGDVGSIDDQGFLSFHGRFKDQLKVGGENVSALEVESFLATHPAVQLAQVVGIADSRYGEVPVAFVELKAGHGLDEAALLAFCAGRIARFKVPRHVRFVGEWPMSATKILKYRLKERIEAELAIKQPYGT